jgi:Ca2+-binding RTX toxin-like protein
MSGLVDGVTFIVQVHGIGATATDNLIQAVNNSTGLQVGNSIVQVTAALVPGPAGIVANAIALSMSGVVITENGVTTVGDLLGMGGSLAGMLAPIAAAAGIPLLATGLTITAAALAIGGLVYTINGIAYGNNGAISSATNTNYRAATTATARDPLAIDLTGDGIKTVAINPAAPILFDHNGDGAKSATGWLDGSDAWLVPDLSKNGTIDSGLELFGVDTDITVAGVTRKATSGFEALAALDANGDKVFDSKDAAFTELRLWQDLNQNGISDAGELSTLADKGIVSIGLTVTSTNADLGNGNTVTGKAVVTRTTATGNATSEIDSVSVAADSAAYNLNLADNPFYSSFEPMDVTTAALALPDMHGSGGVRDLREAMSLGTVAADTLVNTATQFAQATTRDAQMALLDQLIQQWGGTSSLTTSAALIATTPAATDTTAQRVQTFAQQNPDLYKKIIALEQFNGQTGLADLLNRWGTTLPTMVVTPLNDAYTALRNSVYESLALQTRLKPYLDAISLVVDENGLRFDTAGLQTLLDTKYAASSDNALIDLAELSKSASSTLLATGYDFTSTLRTWITALPANSPLRSTLQTIGVFSGAATQGTSANDIYIGDAGNNTFSAGDGNDVLSGGDGNDNISGGTGADTYLFERGSGKDTITDYEYGGANQDTIVLSGLNPVDLTATERRDNDLILNFGDTDQVSVQNYFDSSNAYRIERFVFADGTVWGDTNINNILVRYGDASANSITGYSDGTNRIYGLDGNDNLYGGALADTIDGGIGDDNLSGNAGADILLGGAGNDTLYGNADADTLDGGVGNDVLDGGAGNDTYQFAVGSGVDRISDYDTTAGNTDVVTFTGVASTALTSLERRGNDLVIKYGTSDQLTMTSYFDPSYPGYKVEQFKFSDGVTWSVADMVSLVSAANKFGTDLPETISGSPSSDIVRSLSGNDTLLGLAGADFLFGGTGNDSLDGGTDNDWLYGEDGDDTLIGGTGADTMVGGTGYDLYFVDDVNDAVIETTLGNYDRVVTSVNFTLADQVEQMTLAYGAVTALKATGNALDNTLEGNEFDNVISGLGGDDYLWGDAGNDTLIGGLGNDHMYVDSLGDVIQEDADGGYDTVLLFNLVADTYTLPDNVEAAEVAFFFTPKTQAFATLNGNELDNSLTAGDDGMALYGQGGDDQLFGGAGDDSLYGGVGNDALWALSGNDSVLGGAGNDQYYVSDANNRITEYADEGMDSVTLFGLTTNSYTLSDNVENLDVFQVFAQTGNVITLIGNAQNNGIEGNASGDATQWYSIFGGLGDDILFGSIGNDSLDGGVGNDLLRGGDGSDTYLFHRGDGLDVVDDTDANVGDIDRLVFDSSVANDQLWFSMSGQDLVVSVIGTTDRVTIQQWGAGAANHVEQFSAGGKTLADTQVANLVQAMASMSPPASGQTTLSSTQRAQLDPVLAASWA